MEFSKDTYTLEGPVDSAVGMSNIILLHISTGLEILQQILNHL